MKAVILAAGLGSRLWPLTTEKPKCLVKVAGKAILDYQIDAFKIAGISEVIIVVGYAENAIIEHCKHIKGIKVTFVHNNSFESTNNMYSLWLAKEIVDGESFLLSNGDVVISPDIIAGLVEDERVNLVAVDVGKYLEESMKITTDIHGSITGISKSINASDAYGISIDIYKFSPEGSRILFSEIHRIVEIDNNLNDWTEVALNKLFTTQELSSEPYDIQGYGWAEIDNYDDLMEADLAFSDLDKSLSRYNKVFIDLDGTIYIQNSVLPGAAAFVEALRKKGIEVFFLSNNSSRSKKDYVEKLLNFGLSCSMDEVILSTDALIKYLNNNSVDKVWVLGTSALRSEIEAAGVTITDESPEYIVVGYDTELTYRKLEIASKLIYEGVDIVATHTDMVCPTEWGPVPDAGALLAMLYATTGAEPKITFGKPSEFMIKPYISETDQVLIIGDRLYTDILLANELGVDSILVLTGDSTRDDLDVSAAQPTASIKNLISLLEVH